MGAKNAWHLKHPTLRNAMATVLLPWQPYPATQPVCNVCNVRHRFKAHHLPVVDDGTVTVGEGVFEDMKRLNLIDGVNADDPRIVKPPSRFEVLGRVEPAPLGVLFGRRDGVQVVDAEGRPLQPQPRVLMVVEDYDKRGGLADG